MKIVDIKQKTNSDLISSLERLLAEAKTGEIQSIVYALSFENGCTGNGWINSGHNVMALIGEMDVLKLELINNFVELRDEHSK